MTARQLLRELEAAGCRPSVDGSDLVLAADHPNRLTGQLGVLHTGVRAILARREWVGFGADGRAVVLDPDAPVPAGVKYLGVMGHAGWDRVAAAARRDLPHLFESPAGPVARRR